MVTIIDGFLATARRHADRPAVQDASRSLTYGELAGQVGVVAAALAEALEVPGPVAIMTPHDVRSATAVLGVMAAGRGVIPLDADHPDSRNQLIAHRAAPAAVLTTSASADRARSMFGAETVVLGIDSVTASGQATPALPSADDLAYVLYTSGSTGAPKGAFQTHGPLFADLMHSVEAFGLTPDDRAALFYPPAVAAGLRGMLGTLLAGASAQILAPTALGSRGLVREIRQRGVTVFRSSATLFRHVAAAAGPQGLESLRLVALGGDRVDWADYDLFRRTCGPEARFASHLGATECSLYAEWFVEDAARGDSHALPVGRIVSGYRVRLLDPGGAEVLDGEIGELVVEGPRVAQGYWRDPELTQDRFSVTEAGERAYRTGDLGRVRPDGLFEVVGRRDGQIKLRGFRIELGEIESALAACSGVRDTAVVIRTGPDGAVQGLVAYVELRPDVRGLLKRHLTAMLGQRLPSHMIPADIVILEELPWLPNFKIDRQRLAQMDAPRAAPPASHPPDTATAKIIDAFEAVLGRQGVGPEDDLLGLGGDSLQAVDIALEIERRLGVPVQAEAIDMSCPIGQLAQRLDLARPLPEPAE